ncbi:MAG: 50S ribosomal protein L5 [Phycisphaerales bacterium]|nr:MAG: 50S ribosomal protein L5 [Phycisphaerales bacterium]
MARLLEAYKTRIRPELAEQIGCANPMAIPRLSKVVVSMGVGEGTKEKKRVEAALADLAMITGQKPIACRAKKSVSNFKLREGMEIGCKVTLRGARMYEFVDRLINVAIPRLRDFRGLKANFDGHGNYSMGLAEQTIFSEIDLDKVEYPQGMNITFVTTAGNDAHARALLTLLGMPFRRSEAGTN